MKKKRQLLYSIFVFCLFIYHNTSAQNNTEVTLIEESLNQFANLRDFAISGSGDEMYFTVQSPMQDISQIVYMKKEGKQWSKPALMPFCDAFAYLEPFLSADGLRLYFASNRPLSIAETEAKDYDIWYVQRENKNGAWSAPLNLGSPVNTTADEFYPSLSANQNLYFTAEKAEGLGKDDLYMAAWEGTQYAKPVLLGDGVNSAGYEFNAFVSQKEDFLIYTQYNSEGGFGSGDLYIAKKDATGKWLPAENLGKIINTKAMEYCPFYDEKNGILYFTSRRNELKPQKFKDIDHLQQVINGNANGGNKLYKVYLKIK